MALDQHLELGVPQRPVEAEAVDQDDGGAGAGFLGDQFAAVRQGDLIRAA